MLGDATVGGFVSGKTAMPNARNWAIGRCLMIHVLNRSSPSCQHRFRAGSLGCASRRPDGSGYQSLYCFSAAASCGFYRFLASGCCRWDSCCFRRTCRSCAAWAAVCSIGSSGDIPHGWQNETATGRFHRIVQLRRVAGPPRSHTALRPSRFVNTKADRAMVEGFCAERLGIAESSAN